MMGPRTTGRKTWFLLLLASTFLWLDAPCPAQAFEFQKVSDAQELFAAVLEGGPQARFSPARSERDLALCVLDFDMAGAQQDLALGYGLFWRTPSDLRYFAAMGAKFPDPAPLTGSEGETLSAPLTLGPWAGAGVLWSPRPRLRLALEGRYTPVDVTLMGDEAASGGLQAGLCVAFGW